jgi:adenylyltransferase/sulfurtransferase
MPLTVEQIERYSRQIIVPRLGGQAQERLLASRLLIVGEKTAIEPALLYMVCAGVGHIDLTLGKDGLNAAELASSMRALNGDSTVSALIDEQAGEPDLTLAVISDSAFVDSVRSLVKRLPRTAWVMARLDSVARIAVFPSPPPCPRCSVGGLLSPWGIRVENAPVVAMAATVEALKQLAGYAQDSVATLIEFDGYQSHSRPLTAERECSCGERGA